MNPEEPAPSPKSRSKRKAATQPPITPAQTDVSATAAADSNKNVGSLETLLSLLAGILFVIAALFPRSLKQMLMLALGGGLVYRGLTSQCGLYKAIGIDTTKDSLLNQLSQRYVSAAERTKS